MVGRFEVGPEFVEDRDDAGFADFVVFRLRAGDADAGVLPIHVAQVSVIASDGTRNPPKRESAIKSRHSPSGAASITLAIVCRSMNACRAGLVCAPASISAKGLADTMPRREPHRNIWRAYRTVRAIVALA